MMPVMGHAALESIRLLAKATNAFVDFCMEGMEANEEACQAAVEQSLSMVTSLNPLIGHEKAELAKEAFKTGKTIRELCREKSVLPEDRLNEALDPWRATEPPFGQRDRIWRTLRSPVSWKSWAFFVGTSEALIADSAV